MNMWIFMPESDQLYLVFTSWKLCQTSESSRKGAKDIWSDDDKLTFSSVYSRFAAEYESLGGKKLSITTGDAFLAFLMIYDYKDICQKQLMD